MVALSTSTSASLFCNSFADFFETLAILSAPVPSVIFWIALFDAVFIASVVDFLALSRSFWPYLLFKFLTVFLAKEKKSISFYIYSISWFDWISHFYNLHLITEVKFILSSIFNGWLFWSVNHTLISSYSESNVFKKIWFVEKVVINYQTVYLEQTYIRPLNLVDNHY